MSQPDPTARWIPTRAGILNVWRYYDEVFEFHSGRLLLRGRNGTGKSKALELLLPFLLDANLKPQRLSTFGNSDRNMHWNLMGQGVETATRVGYVWLEFHRGSDAHEQWFTCGARLQASRSTNRVQADYFTTSQRIGVPGGMELLQGARQPATKAQLADLVAGHGEVHDTAEQYRVTVRKSLYPGMDQQRYDSLIQALLQLRRPKLSERLDPAALSKLLSESLPPLDADEIAQLAEGFERLDKQREHLAALDGEVAAATAVADRARAYSQRMLRAAATALTAANQQVESLTRQARESRAAHEAALAQREAHRAAQVQANLAIEQADSQLAALEESEEYRAGRALDELRVRAGHSQRLLAQAQERFDRSRVLAEQARAEVATRQAQLDDVAGQVAAAIPGLRAAAGAAGLGALWERAEADVPGGTSAAMLGLVRPAATARITQITQTLAEIDRYDEALRRRTYAEEARDQARQGAQEAAGELAEAESALAGALDDLHGQLRAWAAAANLPGLDPDELAELATDDTRDPERPIAAAVDRAAQPLADGLAEQLRQLRNEHDALLADRVAVAAELDGVRAQAELPPIASRFRTAHRPETGGAPLWRLIRFHDHVAEPVRAAAESALEAAGLLDAWVAAPGSTPAEGHDTYLDPAGLHPVTGPSLADILAPEDQPAVPADLVARILSAIGWGGPTDPEPGTTTVAAAGSAGAWRVGGLHGSWAKPDSQHIGATARRRARDRRIAELTDTIALLDSRIAVATDSLADVDCRISELAETIKSLPDLTPVRAARSTVTQRQARHADRLALVARDETRLAERQAEAVTAGTQLKSIAAGHGLPDTRTPLLAIRAGVEEFREACRELAHSMDRRQERAELLAREQARRDSAEQIRSADTQALSDAQREANAAATRLSVLQEALGTTYEQVLARIGQARAERAAAVQRDREVAGLLLVAEKEIGRLEDGLARDERARQDADEARDAAVRSLQWLLAAPLGVDCGLPAQWRAADSTRATLDAARAINDLLPNVLHEPRNITEAVGRLSEAVHGNRDTLSARANMGMLATDAGQILEVTMNGVSVSAAELLATLVHDRAEASTALTSEERDLFDRTLTGDTRRHLADRLRRARDLVDTMNRRLAAIRTASGVAVRITWQVDPQAPAETKAARALFLKDAAMLSGDDRGALHTFLRARIDQARAANTSATWEQQLAEVFDYTAWHQFQVEIQRGDGGWTPLTKRLHGVLSGGEKAIALHLPLFAAVAAHYESVPQAPRLILLDEVFVGVDETNRGQVFRLLAELDLDLLLTSDHEWCTYSELAGISIYQLISQGDSDPVTAAHFIWNGRVKVSADPLSDGALDFG